VALLYRPGSDWIPLLPSLEATARGLGLRTHRAEWGERHTLDFVLDDAVAVGARAVLTLGDGILHFNRHHLFALAAERKLPAMYDFPMFPAADDLGLMAYYADVASLFRRTAEQVDQILKGRKPGDIPVTEPQQFRFMVNVRAAQALGLTLPDSLVRQADNVLK
jgi:putative ABC transport system substrate-binding protein